MTAANSLDFVPQIRESLYGDLALPDLIDQGAGGLPSCFDVTGLGVATIGSACAEIAALVTPDDLQPISVDRARASGWFDMTIRPEGWEMPPVWDDIAGLYQTADGSWIRLHTNALLHRSAVLSVLACKPTQEDVARSVSNWTATDLESAIIATGGCAAEMRSLADWNRHPQGLAVAMEPLISWEQLGVTSKNQGFGAPGRPLGGVKVLDCTRVLAGPVCTRFLAGYGADVLRIDPPGWSEQNVVPEITLGKQTATLDLTLPQDRETFEQLMVSADVFVHGYRPGALDKLGLRAEVRRALNPDMVDVTLNAYGWTGPWANRRGYDSLVQMSSGIADFEMQRSGAKTPTPLPVQALDHATGYLMAASAVRALRIRKERGTVCSAKLSLARTAGLLVSTMRDHFPANLPAEAPDDLEQTVENTDWGPARRLKFPVNEGLPPPIWAVPARQLHADIARWQ